MLVRVELDWIGFRWGLVGLFWMGLAPTGLDWVGPGRGCIGLDWLGDDLDWLV